MRYFLCFPPFPRLSFPSFLLFQTSSFVSPNPIPRACLMFFKSYDSFSLSSKFFFLPVPPARPEVGAFPSNTSSLYERALLFFLSFSPPLQDPCAQKTSPSTTHAFFSSLLLVIVPCTPRLVFLFFASQQVTPTFVRGQLGALTGFPLDPSFPHSRTFLISLHKPLLWR